MANATEVPQDLAAEENTVSAMMLAPEAIDAALSILEPNGEKKFYRASHGILYKACRKMHLDGDKVDALTVSDFLHTHGVLDRCGGADRIHELATLVPAVANTARYAQIVNAMWAKRELATVFWQMHEQASNGVIPQQVMANAEQALLDARSRIEQGGPSAVATMFDLAEQLEERRANPPDMNAGVPAPFSFLKPLKPGRLIVLAGYTGDGKTVAGTQYVKAAAKTGVRVGVFSIEMSKEQLFDRLISSFGIPLADVESGRIRDHYRQAYVEALREVMTWKVDVIDDRDANAATFRRFQRLRRYGLLVIDHLHEIALPGRSADHRHELEEEVRRITTVARSENVPVVLLAQLSRSVGSSPFPRPTPAMLRETARIEQAAAQVCFIWRERDEKNMRKDDSEFIVAKDRFGPEMNRPLRFVGDTVRFVEVLP